MERSFALFSPKIPDEDGLQSKSMELSLGKRSVATAAARDSMLQRFLLSGLVEWVQKDVKEAFSIRFARGELTRLLSATIKKSINWVLYVLSKMGPESPKLQVYLDRTFNYCNQAQGASLKWRRL